MKLKKQIIGASLLSLGLLTGGNSVLAVSAKANVNTNNIEQIIPQENNRFNYSEKRGLAKKYIDNLYSFTLQIPDSWVKNVYIDRNQYDERAKGTINFTMNIRGKYYPVCSVLVFDNTVENIEYINSGPLQELTKTDKLIYTYIRASEAPSKYYRGKQEKWFKKRCDMIINELPNVMNSFKLQIENNHVSQR